MNGYIYILQKTHNIDTSTDITLNDTNIFKIGRTTNLKRRLNQYNTQPNPIPLNLQEYDGDIIETTEGVNENGIRFINYKGHFRFEYNYIFTKRVNDCKWVESQLKDYLNDEESWWDHYGHNANWDLDIRYKSGFTSEWFKCWNGWYDEIMNELNLILEIDKKRAKDIKRTLAKYI